MPRRLVLGLGVSKRHRLLLQSHWYQGISVSYSPSSTRPVCVAQTANEPQSIPNSSNTEDRPTHHDHSLLLSDGRTLSYALYGPRHGRPVFFLHGLPSCRLEAAGIASSGLLDKAGVSLIVPDRPGFGRSTPDPDRTILGYADDVEALADHLGLGQEDSPRLSSKSESSFHESVGYGIVGGSGGGPYALACAHVASQHPLRFRNLHKVGVFAGAPPFVPPVSLSDQLRATTASGRIDNTIRDEITVQHTDDTRELQRDWMIKSKLMFGLAKRLPSLSRAISSAGINTSSWLYETRRGRKMVDNYIKTWLREMARKTSDPGSIGAIAAESKAIVSEAGLEGPPEDTEDTWSDATYDREVAAFVAFARETWAQGADGWVDEARLLGRPWGFDPASIRCRPTDGHRGIPVTVWHGSKDVNAPLVSMTWLVDRIPGAELVILKDKGHFELGGSLNAVLTWASTPV